MPRRERSGNQGLCSVYAPDYYVGYDWDPATGVPTRETISRLEIEEDAALV